MERAGANQKTEARLFRKVKLSSCSWVDCEGCGEGGSWATGRKDQAKEHGKEIKKRPEVQLNRENEMDGTLRIAPCPWCTVMEEETRLPGKYSNTGPPPKYKEKVTYLKQSVPKGVPQEQNVSPFDILKEFLTRKFYISKGFEATWYVNARRRVYWWHIRKYWSRHGACRKWELMFIRVLAHRTHDQGHFLVPLEVLAEHIAKCHAHMKTVRVQLYQDSKFGMVITTVWEWSGEIDLN